MLGVIGQDMAAGSEREIKRLTGSVERKKEIFFVLSFQKGIVF